MSPSSMVVIDIRGQDAAQMALVEDHEWSRHWRRIEPLFRFHRWRANFFGPLPTRELEFERDRRINQTFSTLRSSR